MKEEISWLIILDVIYWLFNQIPWPLLITVSILLILSISFLFYVSFLFRYVNFSQMQLVRRSAVSLGILLASNKLEKNSSCFIKHHAPGQIKGSFEEILF